MVASLTVFENLFFSFALDQPAGPKIYKQPKVELFKKINKSVWSHITFYLDVVDQKPVDFRNETITYTCQLNDIY